MRNCHSVDECRTLVRRAMHSDGTSLSSSESRFNGVANEIATQPNGKTDATSDNVVAAAADGPARGVAVVAETAALVPGPADPGLAKGLGSRNMHARSPTSSSHAVPAKPQGEHQTTSLEQVDQGLVVAWLLCGDDVPASSHKGQKGEQGYANPNKEREQLVTSTVPAKASVPGTMDEDGKERHLSLDSQPSYGDVRGLASSSVVSLQSNYKDAHDGIVVE